MNGVIHRFLSGRRILRFPRKWANAVAAWIAGVHSPRGTIRVNNTLHPTENGSLELDVNEDALYASFVKRLDTRGLSRDNIERARLLLTILLDGTSVKRNGDLFSVSREWVQNIAREVIPTEKQAAGKTVKNLIVYQLYRPTGQYNYYGVPITLKFVNGLLTSATAGTAVNLNDLSTPNEPTIS